ncbi:MAG TPA: hypothetical protein VD968_08375, partial [Pyrinomonadaceae bacterium]|nr:hypothetical protein [Pyrinomonadaceae bacterium]
MRRTMTYALATVLALLPLSAAPARSQVKMPTTRIASVLQPSQSPLVTFRLLFMTGSAHDPKGKEGVASLTAAMLAEAGSRSMTYEQIVEAMYPMATSF